MAEIREILPGTGTGIREAAGVEPFADILVRHGLSLARDCAHTLQVNTGYLCNLRCRHCHLEAGPDRKEIMSRETMAAIVSFARRFPFQVIDVTGGAPELVPDLPFLIEELAPLAPRLMLRTNLAALSGAAREPLLALCVDHRVVLVASFPSTNPSQADAQRGAGRDGNRDRRVEEIERRGVWSGRDRAGTGPRRKPGRGVPSRFPGVRRTEIPDTTCGGNGGSRSTTCTRSRTYRWGVSGRGCCGREITSGT